MLKSGNVKNTKNKAKHSKLITKKKNKLRQEKIIRKEKLKSIITLSKENANTKTKD